MFLFNWLLPRPKFQTPISNLFTKHIICSWNYKLVRMATDRYTCAFFPPFLSSLKPFLCLQMHTIHRGHYIIIPAAELYFRWSFLKHNHIIIRQFCVFSSIIGALWFDVSRRNCKIILCGPVSSWALRVKPHNCASNGAIISISNDGIYDCEK